MSGFIEHILMILLVVLVLTPIFFYDAYVPIRSTANDSAYYKSRRILSHHVHSARAANSLLQ